jgi:D-alanyl-D-alanine carboxypeptidase (penicillin-binding protein 5/6)
VRRSQEQSLVEVSAGEELTERQALMAVLLPSANNVAVMLARFTAGSVKKFVSRMNAMAAALGMWDTNYTDPSGFDDRTSSTASDQLILARVAVHDEVLADMMATRSYRLPVAGTVQNTDTLLGKDGFVGMKTGSDDAAGGCFMFLTHRVIDGKTVDMVGVVMGQPGHNLIHAGLYAARQLANRTAPVAADD